MTELNLKRRAFLRGRSPRFNTTAIRPPWSLAITDFIENCERCDECIKACPENILFRGDGGFPEVDFKRGECTFCGKCADVCDAGAFQTDELDEQNAWDLTVSVTTTCLAVNAVVCRSCGDNCETEAIRFKLQTGGVSIPVIDQTRCTGCGACLFVCPKNSISIRNTD